MRRAFAATPGTPPPSATADERRWTPINAGHNKTRPPSVCASNGDGPSRHGMCQSDLLETNRRPSAFIGGSSVFVAKD
jgi:hypothetical protein